MGVSDAELVRPTTSLAGNPALASTFPEHGKAAHDAAGWHVCLERLAALSDGTEPPWEPSAPRQIVHRAYVERLGPEAPVVGPPGCHAPGRSASHAVATRSGRSSSPRKVKLGRQWTSSLVSSMVGNRASRALKAISPSMRASGAPMQ